MLAALAATLAGFAPGTAFGNVGSSSDQTATLPGALVWGNYVFTNRADFARWLQRRQRSYESWSATHPRATEILEAAEAPSVRFRPSQFAPRKSPRPWLTRGTPNAGTPFSPILPILICLGLMLVALSALPFQTFAPDWAPGEVIYRHRITFLVAGVAVVGAIAITKLA